MRHRIQSTVRVRVSVLPNGRPFAVAADQTLVVTVPGDYFLTIGAPLLGVEALPGSGATPGLRSTSIVWEGFNPGHRTLKARARLVASRAAPALPLRIEVQKGSTTFVNTTGVTVDAFAADADPAPLVDYLTRLEHAVAAGGPLPEGTASLTSDAHATRVHGLSGRDVLARATRAVLMVGRLRQYQRFLGNPDPAGSSTTVYLYRTAAQPRIPVAEQPVAHGRDWATTIAVAAGLLLAALAGLVVWSRS